MDDRPLNVLTLDYNFKNHLVVEEIAMSDLGRRRSGGRAARARSRAELSNNQVIAPGTRGGMYQPLSLTDKQQIHRGALKILARTGVANATQELLDIVLPKGAEVSPEGRLCFPVQLMEDIIAGAAQGYVVHARGSRAGKDDMDCSGSRVYYSNSGTAVTTYDAKSRTYRPSSLRDIYDFTRLVDRLDNIHMTSDTVLASEITDDFCHDMNMLYAILAGSEKPACLCFRDRKFLHAAIPMLDMASGGEGKFLEQPSAIVGGCPIVSPLRFGHSNLGLMIDTARLGLVTDLAVPPQAGATSPATLAGTLVQSVAETLACLAVVNLVNPGAPMTFAAWPFITDLRTGSFTGGSGEQALISAAAAQMGNFYNLPTSVGSGMTDAKTPDAQYGMEKALSYSLAAHAGVNRLCEFGGMIGSLMGCSFEAMVLDNEVAGMISRTLRGIEVSDDTLALDLIHQQTLEPGHFLGASHTLEVMESEYIYPEVFDRNPTDAWQKQGSKDVMVKAGEVATQILDNHYPNYFGRANDAKLRDHYSIVLPESAMRAG